VVITLASLSKLQKKGDVGLNALCERLEKFDIKATTTVVFGQTTHVVASKRNIPAVLEGLESGSFIVTDEYVDVLERTLKPQTSVGSEIPKSLLETDFEANWPDEMQYVPSPGKEPVTRPSAMFKPNPARQLLFSGFKFIFLMPSQFESLQQPINGAGGKAILYSNYQVGLTKPREVTAFVKNAAGEEGSGELVNGKNVVVVRVTAPDDRGEWVARFMQQIDLTLGRRSVVQNEFLDPILTLDTSNLVRALEEDIIPSTEPKAEILSSPRRRTRSNSRVVRETPAQAPPSSPMNEIKESNSSQPTNEPVLERPRKRFRTQTKSRFQGFEAFEAEEPLPAIQDEPDAMAVDTGMDQEPTIDGPGQNASMEPRGTRGRKRPVSIEGDMDDLLPSTSAMKKRRVEADKDRSREQQARATEKTGKYPTRRTKAPAIEVDEATLRNKARKKREEDDEARQKEEESLKQALDNIDLEAVREKITYEEMSVKPVKKGSSERNGDASNDRWDETWNGRKNYKKFRRQGEGPQPLRGHRIIVRLEEAKQRSGFGLNDSFLMQQVTLADDEPENVNGSVLPISDDEEMSFSNKRGKAPKKPTITSAAAASDLIARVSGLAPVPATDASAVSSARSSLPPLSGGSVPNSEAPSLYASAATSLRKRPADSMVSSSRSSKRPALRNEEGSGGSEDELRFKFSRRKKK
jgi:hypothetical protein